MPAKGTTKLTAQKFNTMKAQLNGGNNVQHIAAVNGVKPSTVKAIRRFESLHDMRTDKQRRVRRAADLKQLDEVVSKPENQIQERQHSSSSDEPNYLTDEDLNKAVEVIMEHFSKRINTLNQKIEDLQAFRDNVKATRLGRLIAKRGSKAKLAHSTDDGAKAES